MKLSQIHFHATLILSFEVSLLLTLSEHERTVSATLNFIFLSVILKVHQNKSTTFLKFKVFKWKSQTGKTLN